MADYRLSASIISRSTGRSAVAAAAYRSAEQLLDERTGLTHDYERKRGVLHSAILAPDDAPDWMRDRAKLWNSVEAIERRKDAQLSREIQLSLPNELDHDQNRNLILDFVRRQFVERGMVADVAMHAPNPDGDQRNVHAHVMLTTRVLTGEGFGKKGREWNAPDMLAAWRKEWADHQNREFERLGLDVRVDHRSYEDRDIDREPTQHLGPVANDMEKSGKPSRIGDENRRRQQANAERAAKAQELADVTRHIVETKAQIAEELAERKTKFEREEGLDKQRALEHLQEARQGWHVDKRQVERDAAQKAQWQAEARDLGQRLQVGGIQKFFRDLTGRTKRDFEALSAVRKNLDNIAQRETERQQAIAQRDHQERQQQRIDHEKARADLERQHNAEQQRREELARQEALKATQKDAQYIMGQQKPAIMQDNARAPEPPAWQRAAAPEQTNIKAPDLKERFTDAATFGQQKPELGQDKKPLRSPARPTQDLGGAFRAGQGKNAPEHQQDTTKREDEQSRAGRQTGSEPADKSTAEQFNREATRQATLERLDPNYKPEPSQSENAPSHDRGHDRTPSR